MKAWSLVLGIHFLLSGLAYSQRDFNVDLLYNYIDSSLSTNVYKARYNEIWGVALKGKEYGIIGSTEGTHIFDITDPSKGKLVEFIPGVIRGYGVRHRDFHDYKGYLYIVGDESPNALVIADLRSLPDSAPVVYNSNRLFTRSHNIFIDSVNAKLYTAGGNNNPGVRVFSLANPVNPVEVSRYTLPELSHDLYVKDDTAYISDGDAGLFVVEFKNNSNPKLIGSLKSYPDQGYNHSGWLTADGKTFVFTDETHGTDVKVCDVSNLSNIRVVSRFNSGVASNSIAHNVIVRDNYAFLSYYHDGFYVYDISNPASPKRTGSFDTYPDPGHSSWMGAWGIYPFLPSRNVILSDKHYGLFVFDVAKATPTPIQKRVIEAANAIKGEFKRGKIEIEIQIASGLNPSLNLYNILGKSVYSTKNIQNGILTIDRGNLEKGVYTITLHSGKRVVATQTLMIQ